MSDCIFCKIINKEIPSATIWEDNDFLAILDINPNVKGATLVMPKKHLTSDIFNLEDTHITTALLTSKTVANRLKEKLKADRVAVIVEGTMIDHLHIKLYPIYGLEEFKEAEQHIEIPKVFFEKYPGYVTSAIGPRAAKEDLEDVRRQL